MDKIYNTLVTELQKFFQKTGADKAVIGLSGGIDSSLTLKLAVDALGAERIVGLLMPETGLTKEENIHHARGLAEYFKIIYHTLPINSMCVPFNVLPWQPSRLAQMNLKARVRMVTLYHFANSCHGIVLGTSNKTECYLGYGTKFGDAASDIYVIGDLLKTEVWELSKMLGLPEEIIQKTPSAELAVNQTDEGELGATYHDIDKILIALEKECKDVHNSELREKALEILIEKGQDPLLVRKVFKMVKDNLHKSVTPYIINVHNQ